MIEYRLVYGEELNKIDPQGASWPLDTFAIVAFEDGKVVGRLALRTVQLLEAWWVDPEHRTGEISDELVFKAEAVLHEVCKATHAMCLSYDGAPGVRRLIHSHGYQDFPVKLHVKKLAEVREAA
jgi:hypothetical protein